MRASAQALAVVVTLALAVAGCSSSYDSSPTSPGGDNGGNPGGGAVSIAGFAFSPANATVTKGTTVKWTNKDNTDHTVTADDASFGSAQLGKGGTFSQTFNTAGTFSYHCAIHPGMTAQVTVQ